MLILRKDKYTSAAPRCTYLPPHQHCTEVALGGQQVHLGYASVYLLSSSCNFSSSPPQPSPGTTRLRLVVPGLGLGGLEWSLWWPPRTTSAQVHRGQVQVQLGFASLYLDLALVDLSGVGGGLPRATPAEVVQVKSRSNSASPRWTWTLPVRPQPGSVRSSSATVRLTLRFTPWPPPSRAAARPSIQRIILSTVANTQPEPEQAIQYGMDAIAIASLRKA